MASAAEAGEHLEEDAKEVGVRDGEGGLAVGDGQAREPPEYGSPRARVRVRYLGGG